MTNWYMLKRSTAICADTLVLPGTRAFCAASEGMPDIYARAANALNASHMGHLDTLQCCGINQGPLRGFRPQHWDIEVNGRFEPRCTNAARSTNGCIEDSL
ncbi:MAG: hypothetical protein ABJO67_15955 [Pseudoruegeria sp.]